MLILITFHTSSLNMANMVASGKCFCKVSRHYDVIFHGTLISFNPIYIYIYIYVWPKARLVTRETVPHHAPSHMHAKSINKHKQTSLEIRVPYRGGSWIRWWWWWYEDKVRLANQKRSGVCVSVCVCLYIYI